MLCRSAIRFSLVDYLEGGDTLEDFLDNFPSVTREVVASEW
jgi:uncharacterized protein (DUF433 family)